MKAALSVAFLALLCATAVAAEQLSAEVVRMAVEWAPLVWIHSAEPFYPSTVDFFLENTEGRGIWSQP